MMIRSVKTVKIKGHITASTVEPVLMDVRLPCPPWEKPDERNAVADQIVKYNRVREAAARQREYARRKERRKLDRKSGASAIA